MEATPDIKQQVSGPKQAKREKERVGTSIRWGTVFGDDNIAAAVIDRIVHHGRLLQFRGEPYRVKHALMK